ncbi:MAG: aldehyde dehydrogenase family protein, partial [Pedosphaera sp.]|nr:aldehyde dehydrogenase family protein [Pedosphaera sp.]
MANAVNEALIRDVIEDVLGRLGGSTPVISPMPAAKPAGDNGSCGCQAKGNGGKNFGVFSTADEACDAAAKAFQQLRGQGVEARRRIVEIVKSLCEDNAEEWGRLELEETKIGRLDHKIEKLQIIRGVPGVEWLRPDGRSGDHGITLEEFTPFGVVGVVTPSTHSIPTLSGNIVNIVAAGNAVVFNA